MKVDLSVPAVREVVEHFSATIKVFRNQVKKLRENNKQLQANLLHIRAITINYIMVERGCSWEEANSYLSKQLEHRFPNNNSATAN